MRGGASRPARASRCLTDLAASPPAAPLPDPVVDYHQAFSKDMPKAVRAYHKGACPQRAARGLARRSRPVPRRSAALSLYLDAASAAYELDQALREA